MSAFEVSNKLCDTALYNSGLQFCLVDEHKHPFTVEDFPAHPNDITDFVEFERLCEHPHLDKYRGIGISIQASNICAIDVDHCFSIPNDVTSGDDRAKYFLDNFSDVYCEFSFSGTGLRILFRHPLIDNYSDKYYIKNEKYHVEYYQPSKSFRYVTVTGNAIHNKPLNVTEGFTDKLYAFLNKFMLRPHNIFTVNTSNVEETRTYEELMKEVKKRYRTDIQFQNLWFTAAPGSGKDESERDYHLVCYLYENITQDKDLIKQIFESSEFFKTKDPKHIYKWTNQEGRYFNYLYDIKRRTS